MMSGFKLSDIKFGMDNSQVHWRWWTFAKSKVRSKNVSVLYNNNNGSRYMEFSTKLTLADIVDSPGLPGLDDVVLEQVQVWPTRWFLHGTIKGVNSFLEVQKAPSGSGHFVAAWFKTFSPAQLIPGAGNTPLKDVDFTNMVALYSPRKEAVKLASSGLAGDAIVWIHHYMMHR